MIRFAMTSIALDVLEARQLAERGGAGPVGADGKVQYWGEGQWSSSPSLSSSSG